ncbi:MAG: FAD-binding oxidoreductase [Anaerolineales bacterium]|nr:FAD-binding oxidoreductase [Anaerolineales bacterium]
MKRWNGWGNVKTGYPLPAPGMNYLVDCLGALDPQPDASLEDVLRSVPGSHLPDHPLVDISPEARLTHARGQSTPDWVALRSGRVPAFPDGVAFPTSDQEVTELLAYAKKTRARVIPYGGGTSVVGHINPPQSDLPVLTISLEKMTHLLDLDEVGWTALFEAGVAGPGLEAQLAQHGYTLGHYPQSHEYSTLGGWIATRSSGQQSFHYGRIEPLFAGGRIETPVGTLTLPHFPASAAGPDVGEMVLGSEGRMGIITQARVRVRRLPEAEAFYGVFFPSWEQGSTAVRVIAQSDLPVSMLRLSSPLETETTLLLSGKSWIPIADRGLRLVGFGDPRCLLVFGATGTAAQVRRVRREAAAICGRHGGLFVGTVVGHTWQKSRFLSPYLRNTLWEAGVNVDTLETALPWPQVLAAARAIPQAIVEAAAQSGERALAFAHLSHLYRDGASVYTTYLFRRPADPDQLLERWQAMKHAASLVIQAHGGTITHQHGVGTDHAPYLAFEKGPLGLDAIRAVCKTFDPDGMMNPGKLF